MVVASQRFTSNLAAIDCARLIEMKGMEIRANKKKASRAVREPILVKVLPFPIGRAHSEMYGHPNRRVPNLVLMLSLNKGHPIFKCSKPPDPVVKLFPYVLHVGRDIEDNVIVLWGLVSLVANKGIR